MLKIRGACGWRKVGVYGTEKDIILLVDNTPGLLSRVAGLFSRRGYNIETITAGVTADPRYTRMTVVLYCSDEMILEQIKKQLNRMIEVIKVIDFTDVFVRMKEILYIKVKAAPRKIK